MDGGGSSAPTSQTVTQSNIPDWLRPQVESLIGGAGKQLFNFQNNPETGKDEITGVKPYTPFSTNPQDYVAGLSPLQRQAMDASSQLPSMATDLMNRSAQAGQNYDQMATDPATVGRYMSPFMKNVVEVQQQDAQRQADIAGQARSAQYAQAGAFGGARQQIGDAQAAADLARQKQQIMANGTQAAYDRGIQSLQYGAGLGLQGLSGAQQGFGNVVSGINTQSQQGGLDQQQNQNVINRAVQNYDTAQQYPMQQFQQYNGLIRGYYTPNTTQTTYNASPGLAQQAAGLGMGAYGMSKMMGREGGLPKHFKRMASGGLTAIDEKVLNDPTKFSEEQIQQSMQSGVLDQFIGNIALAKIAQARKAAAGVTALPTNLPTQGYAPGGIVSFAGDTDGSLVEEPQAYTPQSLRRSVASDEAAARFAADDAARLAAAQARSGPPGNFFERKSPAELEQLRTVRDASRTQRFPPMGAVPASKPVLSGPDPYAYDQASLPPPAASGQTSAAPSADDVLKAAARTAGTIPGGGDTAGIMSLLKNFDPGKGRTPEQVARDSETLTSAREAAYRKRLQPEFDAYAKQVEGAARDNLADQQGLGKEAEAIRAKQEGMLRKNEDALTRDREQAVGLAWLQAAKAMTTGRKPFIAALADAGATGGESYAKSKEKLDERAQKVQEALLKLDEARLGDKKEQVAAKREYNAALTGLRKENMQFGINVLNMGREDATKFAEIASREGIAALQARLQKAGTMAEYDLGLKRNDIARAGLGIEAIKASHAGRNQMLELFTTLGNGDPNLGAQRYYEAQRGKTDPQTALRHAYSEWLGKLPDMAKNQPHDKLVRQFMASDIALQAMGGLGGMLSDKPTGNLLK